MMIIGAKFVYSNDEKPDESIIELTLIPLTTVKAKTSLTSLVGGGFEALMKSAQQMQQREHKTYITTGEWREQGYKIGRHVTLEMLPDDTTGGVK